MATYFLELEKTAASAKTWRRVEEALSLMPKEKANEIISKIRDSHGQLFSPHRTKPGTPALTLDEMKRIDLKRASNTKMSGKRYAGMQAHAKNRYPDVGSSTPEFLRKTKRKYIASRSYTSHGPGSYGRKTFNSLDDLELKINSPRKENIGPSPKKARQGAEKSKSKFETPMSNFNEFKQNPDKAEKSNKLPLILGSTALAGGAAGTGYYFYNKKENAG